MKVLGFDIGRVTQKAADTGAIVKGWLDVGTWYKPNWFQLGQDKPDANIAIRSSAVYSCVAVLSQELARLRFCHFTNKELKGRVEMYASDVTALLINPNKFQTRSDFFLYLMYSLLMRGNAYAIAERNNRGKVISLTPISPGSVQPYVTPEKEIFYSIVASDSELGPDINPADFVPQRNMLHVKVFTPTHPLVGMTPLTACMTSVAHGMSIQSEATRFFDNQSKPSGVLSTPKALTTVQSARLREAWSTGTTGANTGKIPVLDNDLTFQQMSLSAGDAQIVQQYSMTKKDIAIVFRVPLYMIGEGENQFRTAEAAQRDFVTRSLGFYIEHFEAAFDSFFNFDGRTEYLEFDVERGIMRPEYNARIEGLAKGIQGALFTPNEARATENLPSQDAGDKLFMQRQNVPIDMLGMDVMSDFNNSDSTDDTDTEDDESKSLDGLTRAEILDKIRKAA